jgi:lambda family phage tail tape measure protein
MATIENFILKFKVEGANALQGLKDDLKDLAANASPLASTFSNLTGGMGLMGTGALAAAGAFAALGMRAINLADEIQDMANATGIGADQLLGLRNSMIEAGGNSESMSKAVAKLSVAIGESLSGNDKYQKSFKDLGVTLRDSSGQARDAGDVLTDTLAALKNIEDPSVRAAKAVELLGKEAAKLDLTNLSAPKDLATKEQIAALEKYRGEIDKLRNSIDDALISAFGKLAIAINGIDWTKQKAEIGEYLKSLGAALPMMKMAGIGLEASAAKDKQAATNPNYSNEGRNRPAPPATKPPAGDQGPLSEAKLKALSESRLRKQKSDLEVEKQNKLATANEIQKIEIAAQYEAQSARAEILAKGKELGLNFAAEAAAKEKEIFAKRDNDIAKARMALNAKIFSMEEQQREENRQAQAEFDKQQDQLRLQAFDQASSIRKQTEELQGRFELQQKTVDLSSLEQDRLTKLLDLEQQRKREIDSIAEKFGKLPYNEQLEQEKKINAEYEKRIGLINQEADARAKREQDFGAGIRDSMRKYEESLTPLKRGQQMADSVFSNMDSSLRNFVDNGKFSFKDFANSVIRDLILIELRASTVSLFKSVFGGLGTALGFRANGGPVSSGQPYVVGERGAELFVPSTAGTIVSNAQLGGSGTGLGSSNIVYNINATDANSFKQLIARDPGFIYAVTEQGRKAVPSTRR